jgi:hypothetical protein
MQRCAVVVIEAGERIAVLNVNVASDYRVVVPVIITTDAGHCGP